MDRKRTRNRELTDILYQLKQQFGTFAQLYRISIDSVNRETGVQSVSRTCINIKRMIILPSRDIMKFERSISFLAANKNFVYGGQFEVGDREVIIDQKDLGFNYKIEHTDYFMIDSQRYNIVDKVQFDFNKGWYCHLRRTQSESGFAIMNGYFVERVTLVEEFEVTP